MTFDNSFSKKEIAIIDRILEKSISKERLASEKELRKALSA